MARLIDSNDCEAIVIGAGPYGLAVAAHLKARGVATHVFGEPLSFWRENMPKGMKLRSPWRATSISDPAKSFSLDAYVESQNVKRVDPTPLETFLNYGAWFQAHAVPGVDKRKIAQLDLSTNGFIATTMDGESVRAKHAVVAMGLENQQFRPAAFANASGPHVTHSSAHKDFDCFRGKRIAVVGRGQSACETAVLLSEAGAEPELICRGPIHWLAAPKSAENWQRLRPILTAPSAVGPFPLNWLVEFPHLARLLPAPVRARFDARCLRAAAAGWVLPRFGDVRVRDCLEILDAIPSGDAVKLVFDRGCETYDHVVLATGFQIDIAKFAVIAPALLSAIVSRAGSPVLSTAFESSVPGLYFVGASAVSSLGPLMRFIAGTGFAARGVTRAIAGSRSPAQLKNGDRLEYDLAR